MTMATKEQKLASPKQLKWLKSLIQREWVNFDPKHHPRLEQIKAAFAVCDEQDYEPEMVNILLASQDQKQITMAGFDFLLERLKDAPLPKGVAAEAAPAEALPWPDGSVLPAGRYGIPTEEGAINETAFYKVDRPTEGKWAGYVFVKLMVSDYEKRLAMGTQKAVANKIAEYGAAKASALYGKEFKQCGVCGRGLTNDLSREIGIGPDCRAKYGW